MPKQKKRKNAPRQRRAETQRVENGRVVAIQHPFVIVAGPEGHRQLVSAMTRDGSPEVRYTDELMSARRFRTDRAVLNFIGEHTLERPRAIRIEMTLTADADELSGSKRRPGDHGGETKPAEKSVDAPAAADEPENATEMPENAEQAADESETAVSEPAHDDTSEAPAPECPDATDAPSAPAEELVEPEAQPTPVDDAPEATLIDA